MGHWADVGRLPAGVRASRSENVIFFNRNARRAFLSTLESPASWEEKDPDAVAIQPLLLRDIFGNPYRPVTVDRSWLTSTVVAVARQMYDSRDFSAMPILADALQDGGCNDEQVLRHCRGDGPHVRGCWCADLCLGRE